MAENSHQNDVKQKEFEKSNSDDVKTSKIEQIQPIEIKNPFIHNELKWSQSGSWEKIRVSRKIS